MTQFFKQPAQSAVLTGMILTFKYANLMEVPEKLFTCRFHGADGIPSYELGPDKNMLNQAYMRAMSASANSEHFKSLAPSIKRSKS